MIPATIPDLIAALEQHQHGDPHEVVSIAYMLESLRSIQRDLLSDARAISDVLAEGERRELERAKQDAQAGQSDREQAEARR